MNKKISIIIISIIVGLIGIYTINNLQNNEDPGIVENKVTTKTVAEVKTETKAEPQQIHFLITPEEFNKKNQDEEYILVDIRTPEEFQTEKIPGTELNLDFYSPNFKKEVSKLDKTKKYLYYCRSGHRSHQASSLAKELGFKEVYELKDGINGWKTAGYSTITK